MLLKAFSDFVKAEDLPDDTSSEKSRDLVGPGARQGGRTDQTGRAVEPTGRGPPQDFFGFYSGRRLRSLRHLCSGQAPLSQYRRYTGQAEEASISCEAHLLGTRVEFDAENAGLTEPSDAFNRSA